MEFCKSLQCFNNKEELPSFQLMVVSIEQKSILMVNKRTSMIKEFTTFARPKELDQINIKISSFSHDIPP